MSCAGAFHQLLGLLLYRSTAFLQPEPIIKVWYVLYQGASAPADDGKLV